jgi:hypothetical protein
MILCQCQVLNFKKSVILFFFRLARSSGFLNSRTLNILSKSERTLQYITCRTTLNMLLPCAHTLVPMPKQQNKMKNTQKPTMSLLSVSIACALNNVCGMQSKKVNRQSQDSTYCILQRAISSQVFILGIVQRQYILRLPIYLK